MALQIMNEYLQSRIPCFIRHHTTPLSSNLPAQHSPSQDTVNMHTFTIPADSTTLPANILEAKSTVAMVMFSPNDIFVDAHLLPPVAGAESWRATVEWIPTQRTVPREEQIATLCLTKGELGREIGRIDLGTCA